MRWFKKLFGQQKPIPESDSDTVNEMLERMNTIKEAGSDRGVHYTDNIDLIKQLKRDQKYDEAIELLLKAVELTENESKKENIKPAHKDGYDFLNKGSSTTWGVAPWYYEQLAIIFRKQKRYAEEVSILERYANQPKAPGIGSTKMTERLIKAKELLLKRIGDRQNLKLDTTHPLPIE